MSDTILEQVQDKYGAVARSGLSTRNDGVRTVAQAFGYSSEELASIPAEANMGLSCGNPTAFASLRNGETVVDLGCGGGLDVLLAAGKVGPTGKAIGIDMTPAMIARAEANAAKANQGQGYANVEFHLATIDRLPLPDASVDCVISNCVINLRLTSGSLSRDTSHFETRRTNGRQRHCIKAVVASGDRREHAGIHRLHCRRHFDFGLRNGPSRRRVQFR